MEALKNLFREINQELAEEQLRKLGYLDAIDDIQTLIISKLDMALMPELVSEKQSEELVEAAKELEHVTYFLRTLAEMKYNC